MHVLFCYSQIALVTNLGNLRNQEISICNEEMLGYSQDVCYIHDPLYINRLNCVEKTSAKVLQ